MPVETIWARRDSPEILLPTAGVPDGNANSGFSWAQSALTTICTAAHFGTKPLIFAGLIVCNGAVLQQSVNGTVTLLGRRQMEIYFTEPGRAEYAYGMVPSSMDALAILTIASGSSTTTVSVNISSRVPMPRKLLPGGTLIRYKGAEEDASIGQSPGTRLFCYAFDPAAYNRIAVPVDANRWWRGMHDEAQPMSRCFPRLSATATVTQNVWVTMDAALDADYLITMIAHGRTTASGGYQGEIGLGAAGNERVQARFAGGRILTSVNGGGMDILDEPFIAYRGERLAVRCTSAAVCEAIAYGRKL